MGGTGHVTSIVPIQGQGRPRDMAIAFRMITRIPTALAMLIVQYNIVDPPR